VAAKGEKVSVATNFSDAEEVGPNVGDDLFDWG
jgi:hypothetical protein